MAESKLGAASVAERVTVAVGDSCWRFRDVRVVVHQTVQAVDLFRDDEHIFTGPLCATAIEWSVEGRPLRRFQRRRRGR